jgi:hypothetical protein
MEECPDGYHQNVVAGQSVYGPLPSKSQLLIEISNLTRNILLFFIRGGEIKLAYIEIVTHLLYDCCYFSWIPHCRGMWVKHMYINGEEFNKPLELRGPQVLVGQ